MATKRKAKAKAEKKSKTVEEERAPKAEAPKVDPLAGDEKQLRARMKKHLAKAREVGKLEKDWNDQRILLTQARKAFEKAQLELRGLIEGIPQGELDFEGAEARAEDSAGA